MLIAIPKLKDGDIFPVLHCSKGKYLSPDNLEVYDHDLFECSFVQDSDLGDFDLKVWVRGETYFMRSMDFKIKEVS